MRDDQQVYLFIFIGSLCLLLATLFAGNVEWVYGATAASFYGTIFLSFILILIAGIFWVSAAKLFYKHRHR
jgi:succinate-acetate transporter protein